MNRILIFCICCFNLNVFAQTWSQISPYPQSNNLSQIQFLNQQNGYALGDLGTIIKTTDSGVTWSILNTSTTTNFNCLYFFDVNNGLICGDNMICKKTTDGGNTWSIINIGSGTAKVYKMSFIDNLNGFACLSSGKIIKTTDGGNTWLVITMLNNIPLYDISMKQNYGIAVGGSTTSSIVLKTTDSGNTWSVVSTGLSVPYYSCNVINSNTFIIGGQSGSLYKTTDGGATWSQLSTSTNIIANSINFISDTEGMAVGNFGVVYKTTDGGVNWTLIDLGELITFNSIQILSLNTILICGNAGVMYKIDNGLNIQMNRGTSQRLTNITTKNDTFYIVGENGTLLSVDNSGNQWNTINTGFTNHFYCMEWYNNSAFIGGGTYSNSGIILKSSDGGQTWSEIELGSLKNVNDIELKNGFGYFVGENGSIFKTIDGGTSWQASSSNITSSLYGVAVLNDNTAIAVGSPGKILRTTNNGVSWSLISCPVNLPINNVLFIDEVIGFGVCHNGTIIKTTDGGLSWTSTVINEASSLMTICKNGGDIYVADMSGQIFKSIDQGTSWVKNLNNYSNAIYSIKFNNNIGYAVGQEGIVLSTFSIPTEINKKEIDLTFNKCYPNPFVDFIYLNQVDEASNEKLNISIINTSGEIVKEELLLDKKIIETSDLPKGLYLIKIDQGSKHYVSKMLKL